MATVFVPPPSPRSSVNMSTRRTPLANVTNATNSPHRPSLVPAKRSRTANSSHLDIPYGQPPPKKQVVDDKEQDACSPSRTKLVVAGTDTAKVFSRRSNNTQPSAFEKRLVAARDKERQLHLKGTKHEKTSAETLDTIRQWQRHYRRAFPQFVFYFDSIPEDARNKCSRQVIALGAREEKFFSRLVTHVVTSRPIPPGPDATTSTEANTASTADQPDATVHTVNPSMLEKNTDAHLHMSLKNDVRRDQTNADVLYRARQMRMKIWALEKLQRMIATINDEEISGHHGHFTRSHVDSGCCMKTRCGPDLTQVLRNELLNGPSDRDPLPSMKEMVMFKGPFIYVHDMDEKTKPVMVREYPRVARRQDGVWPQFRSAPLGKCPFLDEPPSKKELERIRAYKQEKEKKAAAKAAGKAAAKARRDQENEDNDHDVSHETIKKEISPKDEHEMKREPDHEQTTPFKQPELQNVVPIKQESPRKSSESFIPAQFPRTGPFYTGREPAASGVQPSNITSAIRSQMISSTAAVPGAKAGISKEVHELKRKVLEKSNGGFSAGAITHRATDVPTTWKITKDEGTSFSKPSPQENLANAREEDTTLLGGNGTKKQPSGNAKKGNQKKGEKEREREREREIQRRRDPKPGYCENCRDKFDDFEVHIKTRKHRKFALNSSNWKELDTLLCDLHRPLKPGAWRYI